MQTIAAIAIALKEANSDLFREYARQSLLNAKAMAEEFLSLGYHLVTGGTDNHMIVLDFSTRGESSPLIKGAGGI
jgi:glycine hydroxymethyltransferase